jgi:uncharacterized membrane protein
MTMTKREVRISEVGFAAIGVVGLLVLLGVVPAPGWAGVLMAVGGLVSAVQTEWLWRTGRLSGGSRS